MWEGWQKHTEINSRKSYELLQEVAVDNSKVVVSLMAVIAQIQLEPLTWQVEIFTFNPGAGEYTLYENRFSNFEEAEKSAWEKAQEITQRSYRQPTKSSDDLPQ